MAPYDQKNVNQLQKYNILPEILLLVDHAMFIWNYESHKLHHFMNCLWMSWHPFFFMVQCMIFVSSYTTINDSVMNSMFFMEVNPSNHAQIKTFLKKYLYRSNSVPGAYQSLQLHIDDLFAVEKRKFMTKRMAR